MPKVSINILTRNRAGLLKKALASIDKQSFKDYQRIVIDDASSDETVKLFSWLTGQLITQPVSEGITFNREFALEKSTGEYVAILDDDDEWVDVEKLKKQVEFLDNHPDYVLVGGGVEISNSKFQIQNFRPESDKNIRQSMLFRNNFFTSTVMFRREAAIKAGGFIKDGIDLAEDYDLWLRMGKLGKMHNFPEVFTAYAAPSYNKEKFRLFLYKQQNLIKKHRNDYSWYWLSECILIVRNLLGI
jgi:glycosyltransferase involved in cell wall biosynthesis